MYEPGPKWCKNCFDYDSEIVVINRAVFTAKTQAIPTTLASLRTTLPFDPLTAVAATRQWTKHAQSFYRCTRDRLVQLPRRTETDGNGPQNRLHNQNGGNYSVFSLLTYLLIFWRMSGWAHLIQFFPYIVVYRKFHYSTFSVFLTYLLTTFSKDVRLSRPNTFFLSCLFNAFSGDGN